MEETAALDRLRRMIASDTEPTLDEETIADLLRQSARVDLAGNDPRAVDTAPVHATGTRYAAGDIVRQASDGERWWSCVVAGVTGSTAPTWPVLDGLPRESTIVTDGTVTWLDAGSRWAGQWDLGSAAAAGWELKAAAVAHRFTFSADGQRFDRSQVHAMCLDMADRYRRRGGVGTTRTGF